MNNQELRELNIERKKTIDNWSRLGYTGPTGPPGTRGMSYAEWLREERIKKLNKIQMSQTDNQIERLKELAKKWENEMTKEEAISFLQRVGILDESGEISDNYPNLKKYYEENN